MSETTDSARFPQAPAEPPPFVAVLDMLSSMRVARALQAAAEFGIADLVANEPLSLDALAGKSGTHAPSLYRLLRALTTVGVFEEVRPYVFAQTPLSAVLATSHPNSVRDMALMLASEWQWRSWQAFPHSIRTGEPSFDAVYGTSLSRYLREVNPTAGATFDAAMSSVSRGLTAPILAAYDFARFHTIVDVGGGRGHLLGAILARYPGVSGILFDQPAAVQELAEQLREAQANGRVSVVTGSLLDSVPPGGDGYLLTGVLHDWDDEPAGEILRKVREVIPSDGLLLVVDHVLAPGPAYHFALLLDLEMLKNHAGRERTEDEFRALLAGGGFSLTRVLPTSSPVSIIEAQPA